MTLRATVIAALVVSFLGNNPFGYGALDRWTTFESIGLFGVSEFWDWVRSRIRQYLHDNGIESAL